MNSHTQKVWSRDDRCLFRVCNQNMWYVNIKKQTNKQTNSGAPYQCCIQFLMKVSGTKLQVRLD
jgi:hypothetical protein